jgi:hypothetical protein
VTGQWFSPGPPVSSTNKTELHDIPEILLKVALSANQHNSDAIGCCPYLIACLANLYMYHGDLCPLRRISFCISVGTVSLPAAWNMMVPK